MGMGPAQHVILISGGNHVHGNTVHEGPKLGGGQKVHHEYIPRTEGEQLPRQQKVLQTKPDEHRAKEDGDSAGEIPRSFQN